VAQNHGMHVAMANIQKSVSILQTADGALEESTTVLIRMKDLATQAADASASKADRNAMQAEYGALAQQLSSISSGTTFGGDKLLLGDTTAERAGVVAAAASAAAAAASAAANHANAVANYNAANAANAAGPTPATQAALANAAGAVQSAADIATVAAVASTEAQDYAAAVARVTAVDGKFSHAINFQIGASGAEVMSFNLTPQLDQMHAALHAAATTYDTFGIVNTHAGTDVVIADAASRSIDELQVALDAVATVRSSLGAASNRLDHSYNNLASMGANTASATGRIMDTDFAQESAEMVSNQMLISAGTKVLQSSNSIASMLMALLR
jgi:flagellin